MKFKNNSSLNKIIYCSLSWKPRWKWSRARKQLWDHVHFVAKDDFLSSRHHTYVIVAGKEELREIMCLVCLKHMTLGVLYHSFSYYISKNLSAWPHHTRRKAENEVFTWVAMIPAKNFGMMLVSLSRQRLYSQMTVTFILSFSNHSLLSLLRN